MWQWIKSRQLTLSLVVFFIGWYVLQLIVAGIFGSGTAQWLFYFEQPPDSVSPGALFGPISHDIPTISHIGGNIVFLFIAGGVAEPYIGKRKILYTVFGLGYLGTYLANLTAFIHQLWITVGASGGILALWSYVGLTLRHKVNLFPEFKRSTHVKQIIEQITLILIIFGTLAIFLVEAILSAQFHSGHVIGLLLGCVYFGYEYCFKKENELIFQRH